MIRNINDKAQPSNSYLWVFYSAAFLITGFNALIGYTRSVYLVEKGLSEAQYGYLLAACAVILVFTQTMIGRLMDMDSSRRVLFLKLFSLCGALSCVIFIITESIILLVLSTAIERICSRSLMNVNKTLVTIISNPKKINRSLGRLKLSGSLGWVLFSVAFGYILTYLGSKLIFAAAGVLLLTQFVLVYFKLPKDMADGGQRKIPVKWSDLSVLSKIPPKVFVYLGVHFLMSISQNGGISYLYLYLKQVGGVSDSLIGWISSASGFVEIPLTLIVGAYCDKHKKEWFFIILALFGSVRWILINLITNPAFYFGIQILHAMNVCATAIVMVGLVTDYVSIEDRGTVLGMFASVSSIGGILGPLIMGYVTDISDMSTAMAAMGCIGLLSVTIAMSYVVTQNLKMSKQSALS